MRKASKGTKGRNVHIKENMTELSMVIEDFSMRNEETHNEVKNRRSMVFFSHT